MKKTFFKFTKILFISLSISLIGFILPLSIAKGESDSIMQLLFAAEICVSVIITMLFFYFKEKKCEKNVEQRNRNHKHNKRIEDSLKYYEVVNSVSENGSKVISIFTAA